jgi:tetratricopeptide (TPR) repeat protein
MYLRTIPHKNDDSAAPVEDVLPMQTTLDNKPMAVKAAPAVRTRAGEGDFDDTNAAVLYETGYELFDLWHVADATKIFEALIERDSSSVDGYLRLVECYSHPTIGAEKRARESLHSAAAAAVAAGEDTLWVSALRALYVQPAPASAIAHFHDLVERDGQDLEARLLLAQAYMLNDQPDEAQKHLEELLEGDRSLGRVREFLVRCHVMQGSFEEAEALAKELATLFPEEPYPYVLLSNVLLIAGNVGDATEFSNNALRLDSRFIPGIVSRAQLYAARRDMSAARVSFEKLLLYDDPRLRMVGCEGIAHIDFLSGRFDEATEGMDEAIRIAMAEGAKRRGLIYAFRLIDYLCELGRIDAAKSVTARWVSNQGDIPSLLARLRILLSSGDPREARAILDRVLQDPEWMEWMTAIEVDPVQYQALAYIREERYGRALQVLATPGGNGSVGTRRAYLRGFVLFQRGDAELAEKSFQRTRYRLHSAEFPYHADPVLRVQSSFYLAEAALARGESQRAKNYYNEFLRFWGKADWDLQAVDRARDKLGALTPQVEGG